MNNGGTSKLFIDLTPSETGKKGQIVRYLHDPDELKVIADSFKSKSSNKSFVTKYDIPEKDLSLILI